ncbi:hypothetical protein P3G55_19580 [Leptospira sp. 96542]|nr:hypothetical protein [Leptospira sp. 96542]
MDALEFYQKTRVYLKFMGLEDELKISNLLISFEKTNSGLYDWKLWMHFLETNSLIQEKPASSHIKQWQFGSMTPKEHYYLKGKNLHKQKLDHLKPIFIVCSILFWSLVYYFLLF